MLTNQLSLNYLSKKIGADSFYLVKESYEAISQDGHFDELLTDKKLAALFFESTFDSSFFESAGNLTEFCYALPELTQTKIKSRLGIKNLDSIKWTPETSDYFIDELGLSENFRKVSQAEDAISSKGFFHFEKPERIFKRLKRYQSSIFFDTYDYIRKTNFARCIIQMPTGSGKTRTSMEIVCESINETGRDVLWLANTEELCDQAFESFCEIWSFVGKREASAINHIRYNQRSTHTDDTPTFHVASLQSVGGSDALNKLQKRGINFDGIELLIVDEAHIAIAPTYKSAITAIANEGAKLIGLTATPGRQLKSQSGSDENAELSDFFYNKLFELDTGDTMPIEYLRSQGILSNAYFHSIEGSKVEEILTPSDIKKCTSERKIPKKLETLLTNDSCRTAAIFDQLVKLLSDGKKIIFFGTSVAHSEAVSTLLKIKGFSSAHIDGSTGSNRQSIISQFKIGEIQILCNYGVLSTGFDDPKIDVVFMARPTNSIVLYSQIIGRGLRGPLLGGTDVCDIYTVVDNICDLPNNNEIYTYFEDYFLQFD